MKPREAIQSALTPLSGIDDTQKVVDLVGDAEFALLGEASHGTHEFYAHRAAITKKLILESGYTAVAIDADWNDAYRINRYVRHASGDKSAIDALGEFKRFPTWMWRNVVVVEFVEWLREYNDGLSPGRDQVGFYGMDVYALYASLRAVLEYLDKTDPDAARRTRELYSCFDRYGEDPQAYVYAETFGLESCEDAVGQQLIEFQQRTSEIARSGLVARDGRFFAQQSARLVKDAETYYWTMFHSGSQAWNLRHQHMTGTLEALRGHLSEPDRPAKIAVWAHNSHLGDARATQMGQRGELNVGQLMRERFPGRTYLVGYTTSHGIVTAASDWDAPVELKRVRAALPDSYEHLFHEIAAPRFLLSFEHGLIRRALIKPRLERAIGVIYRPETERQSHYFHASLASQFDAVIHFDYTTALRPLETTAEWSAPDVPETYPTGV